MSNFTKLAAAAALSIATISVSAHAEMLGHCDITFNEATNSWDSIHCNDAELRRMAAIYGTPVAPESISHAQVRREAREDNDYSVEVEDHRAWRSVAIEDHRAERDARMQERCENRALGREVLGAFAGALASRVSRYGYYGGNYSNGSSCGRSRW